MTYNPPLGTVLNAGLAQNLTVNVAETADYLAATQTVQINVTKAAQVITWANPSDIVYGTALSATQLNATVAGVSGGTATGAVTYNPPLGTVLNAGLAQNLTVNVAETADYLAATQTVQINVNKAAQVITWANPSDIVYGTALSATQLNATVAGVSGGTATGAVTYNPPLGTVLNAGLAQNLTVNVAETADYLAATQTVQINVTKAAQVITWANPFDIVYGTALSATQLNATVAGVSGGTATGAVTYNPPLGTVLNAGLAQNLTVNVAETADYLAATQTVQINVTKAAQVITWANPSDIVYGTALSATQLNATVAGVSGGTATGAVTYNPPLGTVLNAGLAQNLTVNVAATADYLAATQTVQINVTKAAQVITWANPSDIVYGTALSGTQLNATVAGVSGGTATGAVTYNPPLGTVLNAGLAQNLTVNVAETADYLAATQTVQITVLKTNQTISWNDPSDITYGTALGAAQLNAIVAGVVGGSATGAVTYTPDLGTVLNAGAAQDLTVDVAATTNYNSATRTVHINVLMADQTITWNNPSDITYRNGSWSNTAQCHSSSTGIGTTWNTHLYSVFRYNL